MTEQAALACYPLIGKGDAKGADQLAVLAMREAFNKLPLDIQIVIGEGERDKAPRLYTGEQLGDTQSPLKIDVAVDPLEGTNLCATAGPGALAVMAIAKRGELFKSPDIYMDKIACTAKACCDLKNSPQQNIYSVAKALNKKPEEITVGLLNRPRHKKLIEQIRETKARIRLVEDGDLTLAIESTLNNSPIDLLLGIGGAPEGVLAAAALKCLGGDFKGQLIYNKDEERDRAKQAGLKDLDKVWARDELVSGEVIFFATGVTSGHLLKGVKKTASFYQTESLILSLGGKKTLKNQHPFT